MKSITANNTELWVEDRGVGRPILLVHGFPLNHAMWSAQIDVLASQFRVIAPDLRGFGRSESTPSNIVTMEQFADDLAALLDALAINEPVTYCGLSMGGYIAFPFLRQHAGRLRGLILCDTRAAADSPGVAAARLVAAESVMKEGPKPLADGMLPRVLGRTTLEQHPHVVDGLRRMMMSAAPHAIAAAQRGMAARQDATAMLAEIKCPTLVLVGEEDASTPPTEMQAMAAAIPGSQYVEIPSAGHLTPMENPAAVNAAVSDFLKSL